MTAPTHTEGALPTPPDSYDVTFSWEEMRALRMVAAEVLTDLRTRKAAPSHLDQGEAYDRMALCTRLLSGELLR